MDFFFCVCVISPDNDLFLNFIPIVKMYLRVKKNLKYHLEVSFTSPETLGGIRFSPGETKIKSTSCQPD